MNEIFEKNSLPGFKTKEIIIPRKDNDESIGTIQMSLTFDSEEALEEHNSSS